MVAMAVEAALKMLVIFFWFSTSANEDWFKLSLIWLNEDASTPNSSLLCNTRSSSKLPAASFLEASVRDKTGTMMFLAFLNAINKVDDNMAINRANSIHGMKVEI